MHLPLHDTHAALGATFHEQSGFTVPLAYGDWHDEHRYVRQAVGLLDCSDQGRLHGTGRDVAQVLQGVVTNEVKHLDPGSGCLAVLLNDVGRVRTILEVLRIDDGYLIETPPGLAPSSRDMIDYYIITEDATIDDVTNAWGQLSLQGPKARAVLADLVGVDRIPALDSPEYTHTEADLRGVPVRIVRRARTGEDGYDVWVAAERLPETWAALHAGVREAGGGPVGARALHALRVEACIARYGEDIDETVIPLEAGLLHAISENKGCYLGQEVIARIINLSKPVRTWVGLLPERGVAAGDTLVHDGKNVGRITSAAESPTLGRPIALAYLRTDLLARGIDTVLVRTTDGAEMTASVHPAPFHRAPDAPLAVVPPSPAKPRAGGRLPF